VLHDAADLLDPDQETSIQEHHEVLLEDHDVDYRVETVPAADDLSRHAVRRFEELGVGRRSRGGHGLLLVIDAGGDRVRLEVSRSLEGAYPDAFVAYLEERQMVPFFGAGRVGDGILAATELVVERALRGGRHALDAAPAGSGGGGAAADARLGAGRDDSFRKGGDAASGDSPEATLEAYFAAMRARNGRPDLDVYTRETRAMLAARVVTPAQMDSIVRSYRSCRPEAARRDDRQRLAVIRYRVSERSCAPWFFVREGERWRLDLVAMRDLLRFGRNNAWHFSDGSEHAYRFAFTDWRLDAHGFPHPHARTAH
jgi:uncharacterized protein